MMSVAEPLSDPGGVFSDATRVDFSDRESPPAGTVNISLFSPSGVPFICNVLLTFPPDPISIFPSFEPANNTETSVVSVHERDTSAVA